MGTGRMEISLSLLPLPLQDSKEEPEIYGAIIPHVRVSDWPGSVLPQPGTSSPGRRQEWEAWGTSIWCHSCPLKRQHQSPISTLLYCRVFEVPLGTLDPPGPPGPLAHQVSSTSM